jgi:NADPH-dependent 2,4-dienoyl-CoA reductase/sulfur reductase-like enzyme
MKFSEDLVVAPLLDPSAAARLFPTLTPAQIARIAAHGTKRSMTAGEVLVEPGARPAPFLVVLEGELQILRPSPDGDELIVTLGPGQFGGETNLITGRPALLLDRFHVSSADIPVLICRGKDVLRNPSNQQIADCLGFNPTIDRSHVRDLVVVGAGPAGLAAAVYGASEGLDVLVLEADAPGGQAGTSSRIENYLGFPTGISGAELTGRAQA